MKDLSHLDALRERLARETARRAAATNENERAFRDQQIASCQKEIVAEYKFLGIEPVVIEVAMTDDELLAELQS